MSIREFEFVEKIQLTSKDGKKHSRIFWKHNATDQIATHTELHNDFDTNRKILDRIRSIWDDRIISFSFGKNTKDRHNPRYEVILTDGIAKFTYLEFVEKIDTIDNEADRQEIMKLMLNAPFVLGENMHNQAHVIVNSESTKKRIF